MLGVVVGGSQYARAAGDKRVFSLDLLDLDQARLRTIELDFLPHGFTTMPGRHEVAALFEKRGPGAAVVELTTGRARKIPEAPSRSFYGHGIFAPDSRSVYAVEIDTRTHEGILSVRDVKDWTTIEEMPTGGKNPHDALLLDDVRTMAVTNGGGTRQSGARPNVAFVDLPSRKVLEIVPIEEEGFNAGHVAVDAKGNVAVVSAPREGLPELTSLGGLSLGARGGRCERVRHASCERMVGESLSVAMRADLVAATHPYGDLFTLWSLSERRLLKLFELEAPRGVVFARDKIVLSHGKDGSISVLDAETFAIEKTHTLGRFTGSHVYTWSGRF